MNPADLAESVDEIPLKHIGDATIGDTTLQDIGDAKTDGVTYLGMN